MSITINWDTVAQICRGVETAANAAAPAASAINPIAGVVVEVGAEAFGLAADLAEMGSHPRAAIQRIRSCIPDFDAVTRGLEDYARNGAKK